MASVLVSLGVQLDGDLAETPARWTRAFREMTSGYLEDPAEILSKRFAQPAADELVLLTNISFVSLCEHHLLPFSGVAHVGYLPSGFVVGISKLARLVDCHAKRLQIQERMTLDVAKAIETNDGSRVHYRSHSFVHIVSRNQEGGSKYDNVLPAGASAYGFDDAVRILVTGW